VRIDLEAFSWYRKAQGESRVEVCHRKFAAMHQIFGLKSAE